MTSISKVHSDYYQLLVNMKNPASLIRYERLKLQSRGEAPPTYGRVASFAEQGMSQNVLLREQHPVEAVLTFIKNESIFYSKQVKLLQKGIVLHTELNFS